MKKKIVENCFHWNKQLFFLTDYIEIFQTIGFMWNKAESQWNYFKLIFLLYFNLQMQASFSSKLMI